MKVLIKSILVWILTLAVISNAQAFDSQKEEKQTINSSRLFTWGDSALTFNLPERDDVIDLSLDFPLENNNITSLTPSLTNAGAPYRVGALFSHENFSAESGFSDKSLSLADKKVFFIQGRYQVLQQEKFSLLLTAKIESLNQHSIYQFYSNDFVSHEKTSIPTSTSNAYARFGIIGQYAINEHWSLVGGLTSTAHEKSVSNQPIYQNKTDQVALFGTTYTF